MGGYGGNKNNSNMLSYKKIFSKNMTNCIIFFHPNLRQGGSQKYLFELIKVALSSQKKVLVVTSVTSKKQYYFEKIQKLGVNVVFLPEIPAPFRFVTQKSDRLKHFLKKTLYRWFFLILMKHFESCILNIILWGNVGILNFFPQQLLQRRCKINVHLLTHLAQYESNPYLNLTKKRFIPLFSKIVIVDELQKKEFLKSVELLGSDIRGEIIHAPLFLDKKCNSFKSLALSNARPWRIGVFTSLSPHKPIEPFLFWFKGLIEHLTELNEELPRLFFFGSGNIEYYSKMSKILHLNEYIEFKGHVQDMIVAIIQNNISLVFAHCVGDFVGYSSIELGIQGVPLLFWNIETESTNKEDYMQDASFKNYTEAVDRTVLLLRNMSEYENHVKNTRHYFQRKYLVNLANDSIYHYVIE